MIDGGRVSRVFVGSSVKLDGTLDDYAHVARGLIALAEATLEARYFEAAEALLSTVLEHFYDESNGVGVFYLVGSDTVFDVDLHQPTHLRIHCGFPQLSRVHLAQAFVTLNRLPLAGLFH